jgi:hypothetical protein
MDRTRWIMLSLALTPCVASFIAWASPAAPAAVAPGNPKASLSFSQYAVNWKETRSVSTVRAHFKFWNNSGETVKILSAKPSCGCVTATVVGLKSSSGPSERYKHSYAPGEAGMIELVLPTANEESGRHEYTIKVAYNDGAERFEELKFNVELPAKSVRLEPSELYFYQYGDQLSRTVKVIDDRNQVLEVTDVKIEYYLGRGKGSEPAPTELAEATIEPAEITKEGKRATPIRVDVAGDVDPKEKISHLVITTNDPEFRTLKVPMLIQPRPEKKSYPVQQSSVPEAPGAPVTR